MKLILSLHALADSPQEKQFVETLFSFPVIQDSSEQKPDGAFVEVLCSTEAFPYEPYDLAAIEESLTNLARNYALWLGIRPADTHQFGTLLGDNSVPPTPVS